MTGFFAKLCAALATGAMVLSAGGVFAQFPGQLPGGRPGQFPGQTQGNMPGQFNGQGGFPGLQGQFPGQGGFPGQQGQFPGQRNTSQQGLPGQRQQTSQEEENVPFFGEGTEVDPAADTLKKKRPKKPLESYFFNDDERARQNIRWSLDPYFNHVRLNHIDTLQDNFQTHYPFMRKGVGSAYLGNLGAPSQYLSYFDRDEGHDHSFADPWNIYLRTPENMPFYNVKLPFTQTGYVMAGQTARQEDDFTLIHAQNITPQTGFNVNFRNLGTKGIYQWQATRDKALSIGFNHTGKRYSIHAGYVWNNVYNRENGGMVDPNDIIIDFKKFERTEGIPMSMSDAKNWIKSNTFFLRQSYGIALKKVTEEDFTIADRPAVFIGHSLEYSRWSRKYEDTYGGTIYRDITNERPEKPYYTGNWNYHPALTRDSLFEGNLSNRVFVQLQPWDRNGVIGTIDGGVGFDMKQYYQFSTDPDHNQYLVGPANTAVRQSEYYAFAGINGKIKQYFDWSARFLFHPFGDRSGDLEAEGEATARLFVKERPLSVSGRFSFTSVEPGYWKQNFSSNHYIWHNSFLKENETRFDASLAVPHIGFSATISQSILGNKVYFGDDGLPARSSEIVSVTGAYLQEDLRIGIKSSSINLNHRVMLQWSTLDRVVPVPLVAAAISYFYEFNVVRNVLKLQVGVDGRFNTRYHAPGYNPGTGQFFNQRTEKLGEYVWMDVFVTAKWKRMRILLKVQHLNENWFGPRNYFSVWRYPMNSRIFKMGISWNFYD